MASIGNMYQNLPGMLVEFQDGGKALRFNETESSTDSMLLLGTAIDGPIMEPIAVDEDTAELIFGREVKENGSPNGATLIRRFKEAAANGCKDIRLMRITGSESKATISLPSENMTEKARIDESLGKMRGNDITNIALKGKGVISDTVVVIAKGKVIDSKFITVNTDSSDDCSLSIKEDACDAGAILSVEYDYEREEPFTELNLTSNDEGVINLQHIPVNGSVKIKPVDGDYLDSSNFTVNGKVVTISSNPVTYSNELTDTKSSSSSKKRSALNSNIKTMDLSDNKTYIAEYKYLENGKDVETVDKDGNALIAKTSEQKTLLSKSPKSKEDVTLYIDNVAVSDNSSFRVDIENKCIFIKKEMFNKSSMIDVSYYINKDVVIEKNIIIKSLFGGKVYDESKIEVFDSKDNSDNIITKVVKITKPSSKLETAEDPLIFTADEFETIGELTDAINSYSGIFTAETNAPNELTSTLTNTEIYFRGGDDGINVSKEELFIALSGKRNSEGYLDKQGAYQLLENYQVDWIIPCGVYADDQLLDKNKDFAYELALFCAICSHRNKSVYGAIDMKPLKSISLSSVQSHAKYLANFKNQYFMKNEKGSVITDGDGNPIDLGKFITLVGGPDPVVNNKVASLRDCSGAVCYIAYNTVLLPQSAPTNKRIPGTAGIKYNFSNAQLNDIVGNRIVCFGKKFSTTGNVLQGAYIIDGPTCARNGSEYSRLTTLKVLRYVIDETREVADPFIGEANTIEQRNALSAALSKRYDALITSGVILNYSFNLVATQIDQVLGQAKLELGITAPQELRKITTVVGLKR